MTDRTRQLQLLPHDAREVLPIDPDGTVSQSVPCMECGYIVRGMKVSQFCPECGASIARSLRSLLLRFADLTWLGMVRAGMTLVTASIVLNVLLPFDLIQPMFDGEPAIAPVVWFVMAFITGMFVLGQWMLTTAEPTGLLSCSENRLRIAIRALTVVSAALLLIHDALVTRAGVVVEVPIIVATSLAALGAVVTTCLFVCGIADRVPDSELRMATKVTGAGFAISFASYAIAAIWMAAAGVSIGQLRTVNIFTLIGQPYGHSIIGAVAWMIAIIAAVSSVGVVAVTLGYRTALREAIRAAALAGRAKQQADADEPSEAGDEDDADEPTDEAHGAD